MNELLCLSEATKRSFRIKVKDLVGLPHAGKFRRYATQCDWSKAITFGAPQQA